MTKLYVVINDLCYENTDILGVFDSEEKAEHFLSVAQKSEASFADDYPEICEMELNGAFIELQEVKDLFKYYLWVQLENGKYTAHLESKYSLLTKKDIIEPKVNLPLTYTTKTKEAEPLQFGFAKFTSTKIYKITSFNISGQFKVEVCAKDLTEAKSIAIAEVEQMVKSKYDAYPRCDLVKTQYVRELRCGDNVEVTVQDKPFFENQNSPGE